MAVDSKRVAEQAHRLMKEILPLKDQRWVDGAKVTAVVDRLGIRHVEARIYFLRELLSIIRRLPEKIYATPDDRFRLLAATQEALDRAVDEEEA